ncbi:MAG: DUF1573 domain-containing protein [Sphingomonadales bacterium]
MHRSALLLAFCFLLATGITQAQADSVKTTATIHQLASFTNADYNMGPTPVGRSTSFNVYIKNISAADTLWIADVKVGCGCTTPKYRVNEPIVPGQTSFVTLGFTGSARGEFVKYADIIFKNGQTKQVKFYGQAITDTLPTTPVIKE